MSLMLTFSTILLLSLPSIVSGFITSGHHHFQAHLLLPRTTMPPRSQTPIFRAGFTLRRHTYLSASNTNDNRSSSSRGAEFELQELRAQLDAMKQADVTAQNTSQEKRREITSYLFAIVSQTSSPIPLKRLADNNASDLHGKWRLAFSTNDAMLAELPFESTVLLDIYPNFICDYILKF